MTDLWLSGFDRRPLKAGGPYDDTTTPKLGWHTWEGLSWSGAEGAFTKYPPHIGCKPPFPGVHDVGKRQYVPLNRHAYSFAGSESDDEYIIQVEVAGRAAETHEWSDQVCEWLAIEIVDPIEKAVGVPPIVVPVGFHGADEGIRPFIASKASPIRITAGQLRAFSGHLGHQHMPPPDTHWDPGRFPIDRILSHLQEDDMPLTEEQEKALALIPAVHMLATQTNTNVAALAEIVTELADDVPDNIREKVEEIQRNLRTDLKADGVPAGQIET